jgi:hypothetical protein
MRYTVVWEPTALDELADIWLRAADRGAVSRAQHQIDQALKRASTFRGVTPGQDYWFAWHPLAVLYRVYPADCKVQVLEARSLV